MYVEVSAKDLKQPNNLEKKNKTGALYFPILKLPTKLQ